MNTFAQHLKTVPERTPSEWAEHLGISRPYVYALADGSRTPSIGIAVRIARATNGAVPIDAWPNIAEFLNAASESKQGAA